MAALMAASCDGSARLTIMASSEQFSEASSLRATSTASAISSGSRPPAPTTASMGTPRLLASRALRSNSTAAFWPLSSVPSTMMTSHFLAISLKMSTATESISSRRPAASRARASVLVSPARQTSGSSWYMRRNMVTVGSLSGSAAEVMGRKNPILSARR